MSPRCSPFWTCSITPVECEIDQATWIENVLPGLGYDRLRLLELTFRPRSRIARVQARQFDKAKIAFDERRYGDCILECPRVAHYVGETAQFNEERLGGRHRQGWPEGDIRRDLLDTLWKEIRGRCECSSPSRRRRQCGTLRRKRRLILLFNGDALKVCGAPRLIVRHSKPSERSYGTPVEPHELIEFCDVLWRDVGSISEQDRGRAPSADRSRSKYRTAARGLVTRGVGVSLVSISFTAEGVPHRRVPGAQSWTCRSQWRSLESRPRSGRSRS